VNLLHRLTARLHQGARNRRPVLGIPCFMCGQPATGWAISERVRGGNQVIDGWAACDAHQSGVAEIPETKAG
jgi:hypothetical protein